MVEVQSWVDTTRAIQIDPIWGIIGIISIALGAVAWFNKPATIRDRNIAGASYKGKITPKTIDKMIVTPKRKRLRSRQQMEAELRLARQMRRAKESRGEH